MLSIEELANATMKNRAEYTQLTTDLNRLEREKRNELRKFNNEIQRFKARYSKTNFNTDSHEASNVKMYETHNPGFCYKRNGEHRIQEVAESTPMVDFEHLHFFLFTDGEVDVEKILCLHLLSLHETDHLTPPRRPRTSSNFTKKDSPLEQLIERSKDNSKDALLSAILPKYILDVNKGNPKRTLLDERLSARLLVNEKILELITTVINALENSNPEKVRHLISLAEDPSSLKRIFRKQHIQEFVVTLKEHSIVKSSFVLTQPFKTKPSHLSIRTTSGALEDLVRYIRSNVLQFPKRGSWNMLESESRELATIEGNFSLSKSSVISTKRPSVVIPQVPQVSQARRKKNTDDSHRFRRSTIDYIRKNIQSIPTYKRNMEEEEPAQKTKRKRSSGDTNLKKNEKSEEEVSKKGGSNRKLSVDSSRRSVMGRNLSSDLKQEETNSEEIKVHLKQTKCPACMEKWKIPLPHPKVPHIAMKSNNMNASSSSSERILLNPVIKTNSMRKITHLIEKEQFKLGSYDRKYSNASATANSARRKESLQSSSLDLVALNMLDLEKIRHEIREKETKKKLEKFLGS